MLVQLAALEGIDFAISPSVRSLSNRRDRCPNHETR